eukprot:TRINITY_DN1176_c0_g1::TRINITY_DN1176_c0_g1_i1::g.17206::m.17206 TRINITY_DN1176_c0_g1::TRINITY_DN1176_c0_g1_i1::g.17206  ORF type:complete len:200 (+),score=25.08,sp/Q8VD57/SFT2B_MOUSE/42.66/3e-28,Got1/PF04178.7/3.8e-30,FtsX/PF02687.16/0.32,FtsX/PF02687.16/2.3e+02,DUF3487/PF11990.3/60,DUF3487/PF11990.3/36 TRINITY_DN1176_c0_g1_i1:68-601(+)
MGKGGAWLFSSGESGNNNEASSSTSGLFGNKPDSSMYEEIDEAMTCSWETRLYGFAFCFALGWVMTIVASFQVTKINDDPAPFALCYTLGNLLSLMSTMFLQGPLRQCQNMFHQKRVIATCIYLFTMVGTLAVAFATRNAILTLLMVMIQFIALLWYCLSYIPYGREAVVNCCKGMA